MTSFAPVQRGLAYPAVVGGSLAVAWACWTAGLSPSLAVGAGGCFAALFTSVFERSIPYRKEWLRNHGDVTTDLCFAVLAGPLVGVTNGFLMGWVATVAAGLSARWGFHLWPAQWPLAFRFALALVVAELGPYWVHRLQHQRPWLWRIHALHHGVPRLYFLNSLRLHPLDSFLTLTVAMAPLVFLGADPAVMLLFAMYGTAHQLMQHANVDVRLGVFNWVFSMAEVHRWHHSVLRHEMNANYGGVLLVWDLVFGTRRVPRDRSVTPEDVVGTTGARGGFVSQLLAPFRSGDLTRAA